LLLHCGSFASAGRRKRGRKLEKLATRRGKSGRLNHCEGREYRLFKVEDGERSGGGFILERTWDGNYDVGPRLGVGKRSSRDGGGRKRGGV